VRVAGGGRFFGRCRALPCLPCGLTFLPLKSPRTGLAQRTLRGFPLAVGHGPGGLSYVHTALRVVRCRVWRRTAMASSSFTLKMKCRK
jgi:hypothetical protein